MTEKKEMLLIEKTQWESLVSKVRDLTQQVTILKESYVPKSQYYTNKELRILLGVEEKLIRKYREQGLLAYSKIGDKYWYPARCFKLSRKDSLRLIHLNT